MTDPTAAVPADRTPRLTEQDLMPDIPDCGHPNHGAADHACAPFTAAVPAPEPSEMARIVALLAETYTDEGIVIALTGRNSHLSPSMPLIEFCRTAQGRARVLAWAESLVDGNFS